ncbi:MAG TPA: SUF system NifU family Fe-S cluster assembly protein [Thermoanaerobaculia bacterium]|jgi:nitrogen fixation NifU-like protein|nr:SUF system NifU family Fe-S cluster assembly protein [Thermoanaerobaculia bacterium]
MADSNLRDLYQEVILDHNRQPRNFGPLPAADHTAEGSNPLCGDRVKVFLKMQGDVLEEIAFEGAGCAISTASASLMTEALAGKTAAEARALFAQFHEMLTAGDPGDPETLGKLAVFSGVREFPMRVKCATLAWHTLKAALDEVKP